MNNKYKIVVLSAPSGTGKNTIIEKLVKQASYLQHSISSTTRDPRGKEKNGEHYFFLRKREFEDKIKKDAFLEWAKVLENYYGTSKEFIEKINQNNQIAILDIDIQGGLQLKKKYPETLAIFVRPPSLEELKKRLISRNTETLQQVEKRLKLAKVELGYQNHYDFVVTNDKLDDAILKIRKIISEKFNL